MKTITEIRSDLAAGTYSPAELFSDYKDKISKYDEDLGSYLHVSDFVEGGAGRLAGIPIAIKDMICTKGTVTTAGSKILEGYVPPYSATLFERLLAEGAVLLGKNNQDEFAMGSSNEVSGYKVCKNPWKKDHVPGGSSGGSAVSVAAGMAPASIGTDTGGSIRQPAAFCGVVGMKPTYGRISRYGVIGYASSLDQAGPMTLSVADSALLLEIMAGHDVKDATSSTQSCEKWSENISDDVSGLRVGVLKEGFSDGVDSEVARSVQNAVDILSKKNEVVEVSLPSFDLVVPTYHLIAMSEASSNLSRYDGIRYGFRPEENRAQNLEDLYVQARSMGFGPEVKTRILLGTHSLSSGYYDEYYLSACRVRRMILNEYHELFKGIDVLVSPVAASTAFKIGEKIDDPVSMYLNDIFTASINLAGLPGISIPTGLSSDGLPLAVQLVAPHFQEQRLFDVASMLEKEFSWKPEVPHGL